MSGIIALVTNLYGLCSSTFVPSNVAIKAGSTVAWRWSHEPCDESGMMGIVHVVQPGS